MVINTPSEIDFRYHNYIAETTMLEIIYDMEISEICSMLNESTVDIINEQQENVNKIKDVLNTLMENISKLFAKFVEWAKRKIGDDSGFLRYYKKTITETPLIEDTFTMYPYWLGLNELMSATVPNFNYLQLKDDLDSDEEFIDTYFSKYADASIKSTDIVTGAKITFRGKKVDPVPIKSSSIPMQRIYNFCTDFENVIKRVESDLRKLDRSARECISYANRLSRKIEIENREKDKSQTQEPKSETISGPKPVEAKQNANHESYIMEADVVIKSKVDKANSNTDGSTRDSVGMRNIKNNTVEDIDNTAYVSKDNPMKDVERIKRYLKICSNFLGAKLAVLQEQYNAYMFIFRHHVNSIKAKARKDKQDGTQNNVNTDKSSGDTKGTKETAQNIKKEKEVSLFGRYKAILKS